MASDSVGDKASHRSWVVNTKDALWRLLASTVGACFRYRVTGLAAEAAFFAILSLPPLIFGLTGSISYLVTKIDPSQVASLKVQVIELSGRVLTTESVDSIVKPTLDLVLKGPRFDVLSVGFVLALWSGSRALNVFVDTITIMYGLGGRRGIIRTRMLSFTLYVIGLIVGVVVLPLVLAGPQIVNNLLTPKLDFLNALYWPTVVVLSVAFLTTLYHLSVPVRTSWRYDAPGAIFAFAMWVIGSDVLRAILQNARTSIYGPLAAPIAMLIWLYVTALAVLIGAALNAAFDKVWPESSTAGARLELGRRLRRRTDVDDAAKGKGRSSDENPGGAVR
ncbi:MAG: YihY/virulence factor BrkB family protein [Nocardioidaceae bacterium]